MAESRRFSIRLELDILEKVTLLFGQKIIQNYEPPNKQIKDEIRRLIADWRSPISSPDFVVRFQFEVLISWPWLSPQLQTMLRTVLKIEESPGSLKVSLLN